MKDGPHVNVLNRFHELFFENFNNPEIYLNMDFLIGIEGADFVMLAADCSQARSIVVMKTNMDKGIQIAPNAFLLTSGGVGDCTHFGEYVQKNLKLNQLRNGVVASPWSTANFVRSQLAQALRSKDSKQVNMIVGGFAKEDDEHPGPQVYFIDHLASLARVPFATQGYGGMFTSSLLDKHYKPGMTFDEVKSLMKRCIEEAQKRLLVQMPKFKVRVVDKDGVRVIEDFFA